MGGPLVRVSLCSCDRGRERRGYEVITLVYIEGLTAQPTYYPGAPGAQDSYRIAAACPAALRLICSPMLARFKMPAAAGFVCSPSLIQNDPRKASFVRSSGDATSA